MNIGDKVRLLHSNDEGIISKIKGNIIEVEIEDGFHIPAMKNEVVLITKEEDKYFDEPEENSSSSNTKNKPLPQIKAEKGIFIAYIDNGNDILSVYFINNTDYSLLFSFCEKINQANKGIVSGKLEARSKTKIKELNFNKFEKWTPLFVRYMMHSNDFFPHTSFFEKTIKFKASTFHKSKGTAPILGQPGHIIQLDADIREIKPEVLKSNMMETEPSKESKTEPTAIIEKPSTVIDLHIEKLTDDHGKMSNSQKLKLQLETFENKLHDAIATNMDEITFIHGLGNGTLRDNIQKSLSKAEDIKYFEDAMKNKFGYGATKVKLK
ncbi:Smr/MutS family protein [Aureibacter tunicatorum]|uniref:DsDNA-specific endonuclease/ATPase MutS2 n=1 Tax=Aureibacter tunicatorum TaxID=866807 RepID=A0AAE3XJM9_9BACT|nr:Smr/MutS family protein [Aureibacter tunicatorum]MDR6238971.1 dsDNA-specific endonuclease/ATPase MutS2 [Aureibacter tunicatorum]BDD05103.1 hypothetical protein AUTU_25860 [Aureibacter tunicatorum]